MHTTNRVSISKDAARAAHVTPNMRYVLAVSMALATSAMSLSWIIPALYL